MIIENEKETGIIISAKLNVVYIVAQLQPSFLVKDNKYGDPISVLGCRWAHETGTKINGSPVARVTNENS